MKFKVGDLVRIKSDIKSEKEYGEHRVYFCDSMEKYRDKYATIIKIEESQNKDWKFYKIDIDEGAWNWIDEFFEDDCQKISNPSELKDGDIVTLKNGDKLVYVDEEFFNLDFHNNNMLDGIYDLEDNSFRMDDRDYKESDIIKVDRPVEYVNVYNANSEVKEMTIEEICNELGYNIKVVKENK